MSDVTTVYGDNGAKVGTVVREGDSWVAYDLSDHEVYSGPNYAEACRALHSPWMIRR